MTATQRYSTRNSARRDAQRCVTSSGPFLARPRAGSRLGAGQAMRKEMFSYKSLEQVEQLADSAKLESILH